MKEEEIIIIPFPTLSKEDIETLNRLMKEHEREDKKRLQSLRIPPEFLSLSLTNSVNMLY